VYILAAGVMSFVGFYLSPFCYSFHLLEFFFVGQVGRDLLATVTNRASQLIVCLCLGLIVTYVFAVVGWKLILDGQHLNLQDGARGRSSPQTQARAAEGGVRHCAPQPLENTIPFSKPGRHVVNVANVLLLF